MYQSKHTEELLSNLHLHTICEIQQTSRSSQHNYTQMARSQNHNNTQTRMQIMERIEHPDAHTHIAVAHTRLATRTS